MFTAKSTHSSSANSLSGNALLWLLIALSLALAPHAFHLPWWLNVLFIITVSWRWLAAQRWISLPPRWLLFVMTIIVISGLISAFGTLLGREAGVALLTAMAAMKVLETHTARDGIVLVFLGFFLLIAELLYSQSLFVAAYLLVVVIVLLAAQILFHTPQQTLTITDCLRLSTRMVLQSIPVMLILFILFPRIPGPLWALPDSSNRGLTGLSEQMSPGSLNELILSDEVAFRVRFNGEIPSADKLYWRGLVLSWFRNGTWYHREEGPYRQLPYTSVDDQTDYTVMLEPHGQHWLFALDVPANIPDKSFITRSYQLRRRQPINDRLQYRMSSYLQYRTSDMDDYYLKSFLWQRAGDNPQTIAKAQEWRSLPPIERVQAALKMYRQEPFYYTLKPPLLDLTNNIDEFLFNSRRGFCEHYAGSFVYLMRAAGIPARVILGYQGGERNGDYLIVRQSDAHAWAEVWLEERGWVRIDPTAAVAPERVEQGLYAAIDDVDDLPFLTRRHGSWLRQLALSWDKINTAWNEWVLGYDTIRQQQFLSNLGLGRIDWRGMTIAMIVALACLLALVSGWYWWRHWRFADPLARIYRQFCKRLARHGLARRDYEGALDYTERVAQARPELAAQVRLIGRLYNLLRYAEKNAREQDTLKRLRRLVSHCTARL